jgi:hypothetical protein
MHLKKDSIRQPFTKEISAENSFSRPLRIFLEAEAHPFWTHCVVVDFLIPNRFMHQKNGVA